jgi:hypothetical protein
MQVRSLALLLVTGAVVLVSSCGANQPSRDVASVDTAARPSATASGSAPSDEEFKKAVQRYQQCLRDHGFNGGGGVIDGNGDSGPETVTPDPNAAPPEGNLKELSEAQEKCREFQPDGGVMPTADPEMMDKQREWARCLRDKGLEVSDTGNGSPQVAVPDDDPEAKKKVDECDQQVFGASPQSGSSVGGSR